MTSFLFIRAVTCPYLHLSPSLDLEVFLIMSALGGLISVFPGSRHHCLRCERWVLSLCFTPSLHGSSNNMTSSLKTYVHCISLSHLSELVKPRGCLSVVVFPKTQDE